VVQAQQKKLPYGHLNTLISLHGLASAYQAAGRIDEAIRPYEVIRQIFEKKYGLEHRHTLSAINQLAEAYQAAGKLAQAQPLFHRAAVGIEKDQFQHPEAGRIVGNLSDCHELLDQYAEAEIWRRKWLAIVKQKSGIESTAYGEELRSLGLILLHRQKWLEAETVLNESLAILQRKNPADWSTFHARSALGAALLGQKKYADAEPLMVQGYEGMKACESKMPAYAKFRLTQAVERLIKLYTDWNKPDKAARWQKDLEAKKARDKK